MSHLDFDHCLQVGFSGLNMKFEWKIILRYPEDRGDAFACPIPQRRTFWRTHVKTLFHIYFRNHHQRKTEYCALNSFNNANNAHMYIQTKTCHLTE